MGEDGAATGSIHANAAAPPAAGRRPGSRLGQMKFMQRAAAKVAQATAAASPQAAAEGAQSNPERWTTDSGAAPDGCRVIVEDAPPPPGARFGHMSFGGFAPAVEALQADAEAAAVAAAAPPADANGAVISDAAMAAALGKRSGEGTADATPPERFAAGEPHDDGTTVEFAAAAAAADAHADVLHFRTSVNGVSSSDGSGSNQHGKPAGSKRKQLPEGKIKPLRDPKRKKHERRQT